MKFTAINHNFIRILEKRSPAITEESRDITSQLKSCPLLYNCTKNHTWRVFL